ncbi:hypothetical protein, partial [Colwellia sp. TT2012]|uniref:hypothetical protein n=1 Tax=Colwellia sp. TT2012 TaxID=1720342 RepID=UPI0012FB3FAA
MNKEKNRAADTTDHLCRNERLRISMSLRQLSIQWKITLLAGLCLLGIVTLLVGLSLYRMDQSSQRVQASSTEMLNVAAQSR